MIAQEGHPSFCRLGASWRFPHPSQHSSLGDIEAEHLQFSMNARRTPCLVLGYHAENDLPQFPADTLSSPLGSVSRNPRPIQSETLAVPADNGLRLNENQCPLPANPQLPQHYPEQFVSSTKWWPRMIRPEQFIPVQLRHSLMAALVRRGVLNDSCKAKSWTRRFSIQQR